MSNSQNQAQHNQQNDGTSAVRNMIPPAPAPDLCVGIDLGTTFSTISIRNTHGAVAHPSFPGSGQSFPTAIFIENDGTVRYGRQAENASVKAPHKFLTHFKRAVPIDPGGKHYDGKSASELIEMVLKYCWIATRKCEPKTANYISELGGAEPRDRLSIVLTCPATFNQDSQNLLRRLGDNVGDGFKIDSIVLESVAASYSIREQLKSTLQDGQKIMIVDFGGGTLDISVVEITDGKSNQIVGGKGDEHLGGLNATKVLFDLFCEGANLNWQDACDPVTGFSLARSSIPPSEHKFASQAWQKCDEAKADLSVNEDTAQYIDVPGDCIEFLVSRDVFVERLADSGFYGRFSAAIGSSLDGTNLKLSDIDYMALVGGSALLPRLTEELAALSGRAPQDIIVAGDPTHTISDGAALSAAYREDASLCVPTGLGIKLADPADRSANYNKFIFHSGKSISPDADPVQELGQIFLSTGRRQTLQLEFIEGKSGVQVPPRTAGPIILPDDMCVSVGNVVFEIEPLPPGEHPAQIGFFFGRDKRLYVRLDFPTLSDVDAYIARVDGSDSPPVAAISYDLMLALDCSGSMCNEPLKQLKQAVVWLLDGSLGNADVRAGVVSFGRNTAVVAQIGSHFEQIKESVSKLDSGGGTPMEDALFLSEGELKSNFDATREQITILVTDGCPNSPTETVAAATSLKKRSRLFTIGVGDCINETLLRDLASAPGDYRFAKTAADLGGIFEQISTLLLDTREFKPTKKAI